MMIASFLMASFARAEPVARTTSTSRQFIVYGADVHLRGAVAQLAEQTKSDALRTLRIPDGWRTPILVNLQLPQPNMPEVPAVSLNFSQTGFGLKLQLDLLAGPEVEPTVFQRELLRATLLEISYRNLPDLSPGQPYVEPPDWLLEGLLVAGADKTLLVEALQNAVAGNRVPPLREVVQQKLGLLEGESRTMFRAHSYALVEMLIAQRDGSVRLARLLNDLPHSPSDLLADLNAHFPELSAGSEKRWQAAVKRAALRHDVGLLTFFATARALDELLQSPIGNSLDDKRVVTLRDCAIPSLRVRINNAALRVIDQRSAFFLARAHPLLRDLVLEYQRCLGLLARGKNRDAAKRCAHAESLRSAITQRMNTLDDYMNWFEATQLKSSSGAFTGYLRSVDSIRSTVRHDALSVYLDTVEQQRP